MRRCSRWKSFMRSVNIKALIRKVKEHALEKNLYLAKQKLTQGEANHEKSHTGGKHLCATI